MKGTLSHNADLGFPLCGKGDALRHGGVVFKEGEILDADSWAGGETVPVVPLFKLGGEAVYHHKVAPEVVKTALDGAAEGIYYGK